MRCPPALIALVMSAPLTACVADGADAESPDGIDDVGIVDGKADGGFSDCEAAQLIGYVNSGVSADELIDAGVHAQAARHLVAHRDGADAVFGTSDDDELDSLTEIDAVPYVGPVAVTQLRAVVGPRCVPLQLRGTCRLTVVDTFGTLDETSEPIELEVHLDPPHVPGYQPDWGDDRELVYGKVHVASPWGTLPHDIWRAWCNRAHNNVDHLTDPCSGDAFDISTASLGSNDGGFSYLTTSPTAGYALSFSGTLYYDYSGYGDESYTREHWSCSLE